MPGPEHHDVAENLVDGAVHQRLRVYRHPSIAAEPKKVQPPKSRRILVLLADRLFEHLHFDIADLLCIPASLNALAPEGRERVSQGRRRGNVTYPPR